jgi:hypothetical protein
MARNVLTFDINKELAYGKLSKNKKGSPIVYMSTVGGDLSHPRIRLNQGRTPVVSPFGLSEFDKESKGRSNFDISLDDPELLRYFMALDERNIQEAIKNKETWFKPGMSDEQIKSVYYPLVHQDDKHGGKYPPQLKIKVNTDPGDRQVSVTKTSEDFSQYWKMTSDDLRAKFLRVFVNVDISCIWFQKTQFGMTLLLSAANILSSPKKRELDFDWGGDVAPQLAGYDSQPPQEKPEAPDSISVLLGAKYSAAAA